MTALDHRPAAQATGRARQPGAPRRHHIDALTGLRWFAALAVYCSHVVPPQGAPGWLVTLQQSGYVGVTFFFVLSGFVLTVNYFDRLRTPRELWSYAVARFSRVYPLYLVVLLWPVVASWVAGDLSRRTLLLHLLGLQAWSGDVEVAYDFIGPAWSISVELFLYATLPLLVALVRLIDRRVWLMLGTGLLVLAALAGLAYWFASGDRAALPRTDPASAHRWLYQAPVVRTGDFLLGILAARFYVRARDSRLGTRVGTWLVAPAAVLPFAFAADRDLLETAWSWDVLYAPCAAALVFGLALAPRHPLSRLLALRPVVYLGEASFAFYLVHHEVVDLVHAGGWAQGVTPARIAVEVLNLGLATAVAVGLHVGVERPARVVVKRLLDPPRRRPVDRALPEPARRAPVPVGAPTAPLARVTQAPPLPVPPVDSPDTDAPFSRRHAVPL